MNFAMRVFSEVRGYSRLFAQRQTIFRLAHSCRSHTFRSTVFSPSQSDGRAGRENCGAVGGNRTDRRNVCVSAKSDLDIPTYQTGEDTIAAVVTGGQQGAVSILRLSGSEALGIVEKVFRPARKVEGSWQPKSHRIYMGEAIGKDGNLIDEVLCLSFLAPRSYTKEDVFELHCHGGGVTVQRLLTNCLEAGARLARPGEFTLRAFLNGRLDLSQAESVLQLIESKTPAAAESALAGLKGGIGELVKEVRRGCLEVLAELEARLDFDEDMPELDLKHLEDGVSNLQEKVETALKTDRQGRLLRTGLQIALVGRPNVGKSSLLNAWTGVDRAIVTAVPGTTRDVVEAGFSVQGMPVTLLDTAGIREGGDLAEKIGIERSQSTARGADVVILVMDAEEGWSSGDASVFEQLWGNGTNGSKPTKAPAILVANKIDKAEGFGQTSIPLLAKEAFHCMVCTSATENKGIDDLEAAVVEAVGIQKVPPGGKAWAINERQSEALVRAHESLMKVSESIKSELPMDFWTIDMRGALVALGEVTGDEVTEEVLDMVFSKFCIGK